MDALSEVVVMPRGWGRVIAVVTAGIVAAMVVGCAADRSAEAAQIREAVATLPGVASVDVSYINDFENGANLDIVLDMSRASEGELSAAASRIEELKATRFDRHRQSTTISVAKSAALTYRGAIELAEIAADARVLREVRALSFAPSIQWLRSDSQSRLEVWDTTSPLQELRVALRALSSRSAVISVRSAEPGRRSSWEVDMPLAPAQMDALAQRVDELPAVVYYAQVRDGRISEVSVNLGAADVAFGNALMVLAALTPTSEHPVVVEWRLSDAPPGQIARFTACSGPQLPIASALQAPGFTELEGLLGKQFGCGAP
jgi:hypothetical protein